MPLLLIPLVLGAVIVGFLQLYATVATRFGSLVGALSVVAVVAMAAAVILGLVRRHRRLHGRVVGGRRILELSGSWGQLTLDAIAKRGQLMQGDRKIRFIFADIMGVRRIGRENGPLVTLSLNHAEPREWDIPMVDDRQARRWERILVLASQQKL